MLTQDNWVLQTVQGYLIDFTHNPTQSHPPQPIVLPQDKHVLVTQEVKELLQKRAIVESAPSDQNFVSKIFLVEKKGGGQRPVINLKALNQFVQVEHFKMEGLHLLPDLLQRRDWMIKMDLKDAYLQIPIHQSHQRYLHFIWEGKHYKFQSLPFGLSSAPRVFTKTLKPVIAWLRQIGLRLIVYLDDMLFMHANKDQLERLAPLICRLFESLGLMVNTQKSQLTPVQQLEFLGFQINSDLMTINLPPEKGRKIQQDAVRLLKSQSISARELAMFIGKTVATSRAVTQAPLHYRALQMALNMVTSEENPEGCLDKYESTIPLNSSMIVDLNWWSALDRQMMSSPIHPPQSILIIESDASNVGWGARCGDTSTGGSWSIEEAAQHINYLELMAAFLALKTFANNQMGLILLKMDNVSAVSYINQKGGTHSTQLCNLALEIWEWCLERQILLQAEHLPGILNTVADTESRVMRDRCDWMINPSVFQQIQQAMGPFQTDLFASRLTRQLTQFYSWRPDPEAEATDAFTQNWAQVRGYANPPWCLISRCLSKVKREEARLVIVTPQWPYQPWFPLLLGMLEDHPRQLPQIPDLILNPTNQEFIMKQGVPNLIAWPISGNPSLHEEYLHKLQTCYSPHGETKPTVVTTHTFQSGLIGVSKGIEIPLLDL